MQITLRSSNASNCPSPRSHVLALAPVILSGDAGAAAVDQYSASEAGNVPVTTDALVSPIALSAPGLMRPCIPDLQAVEL